MARDLGAEHLLDADSDWLTDVPGLTNGRGVDLVFDPVGGDRFLDSVRALAVSGRLLVIGFAAGSIPEIKVSRLLLKNASVVGVAWGEYARVNPEMPQRVAEALVELWDAGQLHPPGRELLAATREAQSSGSDSRPARGVPPRTSQGSPRRHIFTAR